TERQQSSESGKCGALPLRNNLGRCRLRQALTKVEGGDVASLGNGDLDWVGTSGGGVIPRQGSPQMSRLDTDNWVRMRIERRSPVESVYRDRIGLYPIRPAGKFFLHDIFQKGPHAIRRVELRAS